MKNLHLKNLKDNNIEQIKKTNWFKQFDPEQQYYIESGIKNNVDITSFAKKEIHPDVMYNELRILEFKKYGKMLTKQFFDINSYYPCLVDINNYYPCLDNESMLTKMTNIIQSEDQTNEKFTFKEFKNR